MAIVVESTSTASASNSASVVINKPTGVQVGDMLLLAVSGAGQTTASCTGFTVAVNRQQNNPGSINDASITLLYRTADASDVSASNYTVASYSSTKGTGACVMMRVSGLNPGNPVTGYETSASYSDSSTYNPGYPEGMTPITRPSAQTLMVMAVVHVGDSNFANFSNYSVVSGEANPTWTELLDVDFEIEDGIYDCTFAVAYAFSTSNSDITAYNIDAASATTGDPDGFASFLAVIGLPQNAPGTAALLQGTPAFPAPTSGGGTSGTAALLTTTPSVQAPTSEVTTPNESNTPKTTAQNIINTSKS